MPKRVTAPDHCAIARALDVLGEWWTFLIIRDALYGIRHFEGFQRSLGIARNVLSARLGKLVEVGILSRRQSAEDRRRVEYRLTEKGRDLFPLIMALGHWGAKWATEPGHKKAFEVVERVTGRPIEPVQVRAQDGRPLRPSDTAIIPGPAMTEEIARTIPALVRPPLKKAKSA